MKKFMTIAIMIMLLVFCVDYQVTYAQEGEGEPIPATEADLTLQEWPEYSKVLGRWYHNIGKIANRLQSMRADAAALGMTTEEINSDELVSRYTAHAVAYRDSKPTVDSWRASMAEQQEE